jgi:hypothetical protein
MNKPPKDIAGGAPALPPDTKLVVSGRDPLAHHGYVNPPVYHASTLLYPSAVCRALAIGLALWTFGQPAIADPLAAYHPARAGYEAAANAYWSAIAAKRRIRFAKRRNNEEIVIEDYVLTQPPVYSGPPRPVDPEGRPAPPRKYVPVVADFLKAAAEHFSFVPQRPRSEIEFKRAYGRTASAAGLTRDQAVRVYGFETGGNGTCDTQAGVGHRKRGRAISTALGYNQLLHINSVSILAVHGDRIVKALQQRAEDLEGSAKAGLESKIPIVRRMIEFARSVPVRWSEHEKLADTPQGIGPHALNLDIDVGPLLQTQKLIDSVVFAKRKGMDRPLRAVELELMNFTGDGNGFDMVSMPEAMRGKVPTANFFRQSGYERNPVASRNNVVAELMAVIEARMDRASKQPGAKDLAAAFPR